jgi:hypothetical protein
VITLLEDYAPFPLSSPGAICALPNFSGCGFVNGPWYYAWTAVETLSSCSWVVAASVAATPYYCQAAAYCHTGCRNKPVSLAPYCNKSVGLTLISSRLCTAVRALQLRVYTQTVPWKDRPHQTTGHHNAHFHLP